MLIPNHPHDERLSALASGDPEALADSELSGHVNSCHRCTDTVAELGALRTSLAELPDLRPHRPLQLLPPVDEAPTSRVDRVGGWARRFFAPVLTAGAALAIAGLVGTTAPLLPMAQIGGGADSAAGEAQPDTTDAGDATTFQYGEAGSASEPANVTDGATEGTMGVDAEEPAAAEPLESAAALQRDSPDIETFAATEGRSIWPMVLFAGVALMIAAALFRWVLAPRAG
jgi:anti-sigma factor RsiW